MSYKGYIDNLSNNLNDMYKEYLKEKDININNNIIRKVNLTMASACENEVAKLVSEVLNKKYNILIDVYLSYTDEKAPKRKNKAYRPDIVIMKTNNNNGIITNEIVGLIEVKAQMGYTGILTPDIYEYRIKRLNNSSIEFSDEEYDLLSDDAKKFYRKMGLTEEHKEIEYKIKKDLKLYVINVMASNHIQNVDSTIYYFDQNKNNAKFYTIYGEKVWYNSLSSNSLFEFDKSIKEIKDKKVKVYKEKNNELKEVTETISYKINNDVRMKHGFTKLIDDIKEMEE